MGNIYHSWNGTVLTITSDSGTSSADLQGEMGVRGPQGPAGVVPLDRINEILNNTPIEVSYEKDYSNVPFGVEWVKYLDGRVVCSIHIDVTEPDGVTGIMGDISFPFVINNANISTALLNTSTAGTRVEAFFYGMGEDSSDISTKQGYELCVNLEHDNPDGNPITWEGTVTVIGQWR